MKVSVVIPAYNEEKYISACLDSLMRQEIKPDEIIVVNNSSTDGTEKIVSRYPVRLVYETTMGITPARNRGFNEAQFEIIARTDADTIVPPDWIKRIKKYFKEQDLVALSGPAHFYDLPEVIQSANKWTTEAFFSYMRLIKKIMKSDTLYGPNMAMRKNAWEKIKDNICLNDQEVHEDIDLGIHLSNVGKIKFDFKFIVDSSFRRWKKIDSYIDYTNRMVKSIRKHKQFVVGQKSRELVKRIVSKAFLVDRK